jgi:hypothetical protein
VLGYIACQNTEVALPGKDGEKYVSMAMGF